MLFENIVSKLKGEGYLVQVAEFSYMPCKAVTGTCLVDVIDGIVTPTTGTYKDVIKQITEGKSHIYNIETIKGCKKKTLSPYQKLG